MSLFPEFWFNLMSLEAELRVDEAFDVGLGDGAVDVGDDEPRILGQEVNRKRNLDVERVDDEQAVVESGLENESEILICLIFETFFPLPIPQQRSYFCNRCIFLPPYAG